MSPGKLFAQYFGWSYGRLQKPARDSRFMTVVILLLVAATAFALTTVDPIRVTIVAVTVSGMLLPFMFFPLMLAANDRTVMDDMANGRISNAVGSVMLVVTSVVATSAFPLLVLTRGGSS